MRRYLAAQSSTQPDSMVRRRAIRTQAAAENLPLLSAVGLECRRLHHEEAQRLDSHQSSRVAI